MDKTAYNNLIGNADNEMIVSATGFRTLFILKALMIRDLDIDELCDLISQTGKSVSPDTVRICLSTLKSAGCKFSRPCRSNSFKYHLESHPFNLRLSEEDVDLLINLRDNLPENTTYENILATNSLYRKISALTQNEEQRDKINYSALLCNVDEQIIKQLCSPKILRKKVIFEYLSPEYGIENIKAVPIGLSFENKKLYLKCYLYKYDSASLLDTERIIKIVAVSADEVTNDLKSTYNVIYTVSGEARKEFEPKEYETVISETDEAIEVKAEVSNEFCFIQRLLLLGEDFTVKEPYFFKEKLVSLLKDVIAKYNDNP